MRFFFLSVYLHNSKSHYLLFSSVQVFVFLVSFGTLDLHKIVIQLIVNYCNGKLLHIMNYC